MPPLQVTHFSGEVYRAISAVPDSVTLYDQIDDDAGVAAISTVFDDAVPTSIEDDAYGADDFAVPTGYKCEKPAAMSDQPRGPPAL